MMKNSKKNEAVNILCIKEWAFYIFFFFTVSADAQVTLEYNSSLNKSWESFFPTVGKQIQFIFYTTILIIVIFPILL